MTEVMSPIKVLFVSPSMRLGGAERNLLNIANSLDPTAFQVSFCVLTGESSEFDVVLNEHIRVVFLNRRRVLTSFPFFTHEIIQTKPDLVFTSADHVAQLVYAIRVLTGADFKLVHRLSSLPSNRVHRGVRGKSVQSLRKRVFNSAAAIIAQTEEIKREVSFYFDVQERNIWVIRNFVDFKSIRAKARSRKRLYSDKAVNAVMVGTVYPAKGHDILLEAMPRILESFPNFRLHIVGRTDRSPAYVLQLKSVIRSYGLDDTVTFHGQKSNPFPLIHQADVFILASRYEGFPNVVLEALTLGVPVIASNCVNFDGIIEPGVNGLIVEKENPEALAAGVVSAIATLRRSENFTWTNFDYNQWLSDISRG